MKPQKPDITNLNALNSEFVSFNYRILTCLVLFTVFFASFPLVRPSCTAFGSALYYPVIYLRVCNDE